MIDWNRVAVREHVAGSVLCSICAITASLCLNFLIEFYPKYSKSWVWCYSTLKFKSNLLFNRSLLTLPLACILTESDAFPFPFTPSFRYTSFVHSLDQFKHLFFIYHCTIHYSTEFITKHLKNGSLTGILYFYGIWVLFLVAISSRIPSPTN